MEDFDISQLDEQMIYLMFERGEICEAKAAYLLGMDLISFNREAISRANANTD